MTAWRLQLSPVLGKSRPPLCCARGGGDVPIRPSSISLDEVIELKVDRSVGNAVSRVMSMIERRFDGKGWLL